MFRYEKRIRDPKAEQDQLAAVQKGTESLQAELKTTGKKITTLEDDVLSKDPLLDRQKVKIEGLVGRNNWLKVDLDDKKSKISLAQLFDWAEEGQGGCRGRPG